MVHQLRIHLVIDEAIDFQYTAGIALAILQDPLFEQFHKTKIGFSTCPPILFATDKHIRDYGSKTAGRNSRREDASQVKRYVAQDVRHQLDTQAQ